MANRGLPCPAALDASNRLRAWAGTIRKRCGLGLADWPGWKPGKQVRSGLIGGSATGTGRTVESQTLKRDITSRYAGKWQVENQSLADHERRITRQNLYFVPLTPALIFG